MESVLPDAIVTVWNVAHGQVAKDGKAQISFETSSGGAHPYPLENYFAFLANHLLQKAFHTIYLFPHCYSGYLANQLDEIIEEEYKNKMTVLMGSTKPIISFMKDTFASFLVGKIWIQKIYNAGKEPNEISNMSPSEWLQTEHVTLGDFAKFGTKALTSLCPNDVDNSITIWGNEEFRLENAKYTPKHFLVYYAHFYETPEDLFANIPEHFAKITNWQDQNLKLITILAYVVGKKITTWRIPRS